jgi:hypothetical protein
VATTRHGGSSSSGAFTFLNDESGFVFAFHSVEGVTTFLSPRSGGKYYWQFGVFL